MSQSNAMHNSYNALCVMLTRVVVFSWYDCRMGCYRHQDYIDDLTFRKGQHTLAKGTGKSYHHHHWRNSNSQNTPRCRLSLESSSPGIRVEASDHAAGNLFGVEEREAPRKDQAVDEHRGHRRLLEMQAMRLIISENNRVRMSLCGVRFSHHPLS